MTTCGVSNNKNPIEKVEEIYPGELIFIQNKNIYIILFYLSYSGGYQYESEIEISTKILIICLYIFCGESNN